MIVFSVISIVFIVSSSIDCKSFGDDDEWTYDNQDEWNLHFKACHGERESPINIDTTKLIVDSKLKLKFHNYVPHHKSTAQNNGHTVRVFLHINDKNQIPYVTGPAVGRHKKYILDSFHFHWGLNDFNGSEHSINNIKRSAELHLVHWNSDYKNVSNASTESDGLLVVTVFIETKVIEDYGVVEVDEPNEAIAPIIDVLSHIKEFSKSVRIGVAINLDDLLPDDIDLFYKYRGSLTTPPCSPSATFVIFREPIYMTSDQLSQFRRIREEPIDGKSVHLRHNSREQMPLNDRVVTVSNPFSHSNTKIDK